MLCECVAASHRRLGPDEPEPEPDEPEPDRLRDSHHGLLLFTVALRHPCGIVDRSELYVLCGEKAELAGTPTSPPSALSLRRQLMPAG